MKGAQPSDTVKAILSYKGVYMKKHLLVGVEKGAFDENEAQNRFDKWIADKESKISDKKSNLDKENQAAKKAKLEAEKLYNEEKAKAIKEKDRHLGVILSFNVKIFDDAVVESEESHVRIFDDKIIYSLIDNYSLWVEQDSADVDSAIFNEMTPIVKFTFLKGYIFRNNNPAVFGIIVDAGKLRQKIPFMNESGKKVGIVHQLQNDGKTVPIAKTGEEVACSVQNITIGRQISEEDIFYSLPTPDEAKKLLKNYMHKLNPEESKIFSKILEIQRKINPVYGY